MQTTTRRAAAVAGAFVLTLSVAACSSDGPTPTASSTSSSTSITSGTSAPSSPAEGAADAPSPAQVIEKTKASTGAAKSAAFQGEVEQAGKKMAIDFKGTEDGSTADVTVEMEGQGKVRLIAIGADVYMQADETFWKSQGAPANVQKAGDKFIKAPADSASLTKSLSLNAFLDEAFGAVRSDQLSDEVGEETVNGVDCWVLTDKAGASNGALYVAKDTFTLVRFTGSAASPGSLDFSKWNEDLGIKAPAASSILDLS